MDRCKPFDFLKGHNPSQRQPIDDKCGDEDDIDDPNVDCCNYNNQYAASNLSSSPPNDFDINIESQYVPIQTGDDLSFHEENQQVSSLASSLSIESDHHNYPTSPVKLTTNSRIIRCPACEKPMRTFYCAKCIQRGHFVTLETSIKHGYTQKSFKQIPLNQVQDIHHDIDTSYEKTKNFVDVQQIELETLQVKLRTLTKKTQALKNLFLEQTAKLQQTKELVRKTKTQIELDKKSNKSKLGKIELIKRFIASRESSVKKRRKDQVVLHDELKQYVHRRLFQLLADVFPIEEINLFDQSNSFVNMETSPLLTFSDGSHHQIEQQTAYSIIEPWLPTNGDYSAYSLWVNDNQEHVKAPVADLSERNPAFRIQAALAYTTQLVNNLAAYLDIAMPAQMSSFNGELLNDTQFTHNVAKLNTNIVHLCASQGIDVSLLNPRRTLKNLMLLFNLNVSDLGRKPIMDLDNEEAVNRIEEQLNGDLSLIQEEFYDFTKYAHEDDASDSEWEISDTISPIDMQQLASEQSIQQNSYISLLPLPRLFASFWSTDKGV